jgi:hypothetical protein
MKFSSIKDAVTSKAARQLLTAQKHSPTILFSAGVIGVVATVVLASKATLKVEQEVLIDAQKNLGLIKDTVRPDYSDEDKAKDTAVVYIQAAGKLTKLYGPAVIVGAVSIACLTGSHVVLSRRNAGLTAAYVALEKGFNKYRERVVDEFGEEKDREFRYGVEDVVVEDENGEKTVVRRAASDGPSIYAKLWDENSSSWNHNPDYNMVFLKAQQKYANDRLHARGHLFLNEVYDDLGLDRTPEGQIVGWVLDDEGDGYVDFGIFNDDMMPEHLAFFTGRENAIWLDFNVDGPVYQKI